MELTRLRAMDQCLRQLSTAVSTASLYAPEHQQVTRLCQQAYKALFDAIEGLPSLSLVRVDDQLAVEGTPLSESMYLGRFARLMRQRGIGHIKFINGIKGEELLDLVKSFARRDDKLHSSPNLRLGQIEVRHRNDGVKTTGQISAQASSILGDVSGEELARVMEVYETVKNSRRLNVVGLNEIVTQFIDVFASYADPLLTLVPLRDMDEYTFTHSLNVCLLNLAQATSLGIQGPLLHDIGLSAMLHDIGKLFIPEEVLNKPARLNEEERALINVHPVKGAEFLLDTPGVPRMAVVNAYEHHMRFDLRGYPEVDDRWKQNLCSQMTTISDIYDSLRTKRPYREPMDVHGVLITIEQLMGSQLHPLLAENFLRLMKKVTPEAAD